jgi:methylated-DNA-[protein]-cysteine S-methyltransferase
MTLWQPLETPIGELTLIGDGETLTEILFANSPRRKALRQSLLPGELPLAARELTAYFAGTLQAFTVPLAPRGTPFQLRVWELLRQIPYAETTTYGALAAQLGNPQASRAVGLANGANPLPIIVPCHRVIGANGQLTGFAGGLPAKSWLLDRERHCKFFGTDRE